MAGKGYNQEQNANRVARKKARKRKRKRILLVLEGLFLLVLIAAAYATMKFDKLEITPIDEDEDISVNEEVKENEIIKKYTNIALFGIDSRDESLGNGNRSDTMMIASINNETHEIKLVSVYRDTYLLIPREENAYYDKANLGYFYGGPKMAINLMNTNLDLDITDYVSVNFSALIDTIDALGGIDIEINEYEREYINGYMTETSQITGKEIEPLYETGLVHLNGLQATSYCRIRQTAGDDYRRTERQRLVISKIAEKAKQADLVTLNAVVDKVLPNVSTSLEIGEIYGLVKDIAKYELVDNVGFPFEKQGHSMGSKGDCVIPLDLDKNVAELHSWLFGAEEYTSSSMVKAISDTIKEESGLTGTE